MMAHSSEETAMPIETALTVAAIIAVFSAFAITLAWAEYRTRGADRF
jgi:hypothetical protein